MKPQIMWAANAVRDYLYMLKPTRSEVRKALEEQTHRTWRKLKRQGYRIVKVRVEEVKEC